MQSMALKEGDRIDGADSIHQLFEYHAEKHPQSVAIVHNSEKLSYGELNFKANQLAHFLIAEGLQPGALVGLHTERNVQTAIAILGILKAGGAYVPLDPDNPEPRNKYIIKHADVRMIDPAHAHPEIEKQPSHNPEPNIKPSGQAYAIYTSGTTGLANGVCISHQNVLALLAATQSRFEFGEDDVWTLFHSFAFDFSVWEFFGCLTSGGRLVITPYWTARTPDEFHKLLNEQRVTVLNQTPSAFWNLLRADAETETRLTALRTVIFGGESLTMPNLEPWFEKYGEDRPQLFNMYGITETTVHCTVHRICKADLTSNQSNIGQPLTHCKIHLLDENGKETTPGQTGEIYIEGPGLSAGYLNNPALTARKFVPHPVSDHAGVRLYRSGDLARRSERGDLEFLGRTDDQVKIRGYRVEPGEIENTLLEEPAVKSAVVLPVERDEEVRLEAFIVVENSDETPLTTIKQALKSKLPDYLIPSDYHTMKEFPLTNNGKIDRKTLFENIKTTAEATTASPPAGSALSLLSEIFQRKMKLTEALQKADNFLELGGHSFLAVQITRAISEQFKVQISMRSLFTKTLEQLSQEIEEARKQTTV